MSRNHKGGITASSNNKNTKFKEVPTSGLWGIAYGLDHTPMGYFIEFFPLDDEAKEQCSVCYENEDGTKEYNPIALDQLFSNPKLTTSDWFSILHTFGIEG